MRSVFIALFAALLSGCASYATPGRGANMSLFAAGSDRRDPLTDASVANALNKHPLARLPASIAVVRVQASGYRSRTAQGWGDGAYSIITSRDIDDMDKVFHELSARPMINGVAPLNRLLLPSDLHSDLELRQAAASLHADMLLIYTLDTTFEVQDVAAPLTVVTLGLSPNQVAHVTCTASAVLLDTRNGYVYGVADGTERQNQLASGWTSGAAVDQTRRRVEAEAFKKLGESLATTWDGVVKNYSLAQR